MHNLNYNSETGRYSFVSAIEPAWHKLGTLLDHVFTAKEAIEHGGWISQYTQRVFDRFIKC